MNILKAKGIFLFTVATILLTNPGVQAGEKNLRPLFEKYGIGIYDQGKRGTCSVFAITGLLEFEYAKTTGKATPLSIEYLNWASNQVAGEPVDGCYFSEALAALNKYGICTNELFPYYIEKYSSKVAPSDAALKEAKSRRNSSLYWIKEWAPNTGMTEKQIEQVKEQIRNEHPVAIGFQWPKKDEKYRRMKNGIMIIPPRKGVFDGHSIIMVGFKDQSSVAGGGYFIFKNSHGNDYGDNGYGKMPYEYLAKYANDGVAIHLEK